MKFRKGVAAVSTSLAALVTAAPALADENLGKWYLGLHVGTSRSDISIDKLSPDFDASDCGLSGPGGSLTCSNDHRSTSVQLLLGRRLSDIWSIEIGAISLGRTGPLAILDLQCSGARGWV